LTGREDQKRKPSKVKAPGGAPRANPRRIIGRISGFLNIIIEII